MRTDEERAFADRYGIAKEYRAANPEEADAGNELAVIGYGGMADVVDLAIWNGREHCLYRLTHRDVERLQAYLLRWLAARIEREVKGHG